MAARVREMTSGKPAGLIFFFALPLMLGNVFQQMYTMVDTIIRGTGGRGGSVGRPGRL